MRAEVGEYGGCISVIERIVYKDDPAAFHDWRLVSREWFDVTITEPSLPVGWQETWYCTRCRIVDERLASADA